jgi:hypothetical protein
MKRHASATLAVPELRIAIAKNCRYEPPRAERADQHIRRGGRVVERTALEMRHTCKGIVGSNPTLSAILS